MTGLNVMVHGLYCYVALSQYYVLITIPAGINKMNVVTFVVLSLLGTTIWNFALILLGRMLSGSFDALMAGLHIPYIMYVIIILAVLYVLYRIFFKNRNRVK